MKKPGATNQDPIFKNQSLPEGNEPGYPGVLASSFEMLIAPDSLPYVICYSFIPTM